MTADRVIDTRRSVLTSDRRITLLFCALAAIAVLITALHGLGVDVDGTAYLNAGVSLANGQGLKDFGGTYTLFAPALPVLVAAGVHLGLSAQSTSLILNIASAVLTVIFGRILLKRHVSDRRLIFAGTIFIAIGWPLLQVTSLALTEPLTIVVVILLILLLEDFETTRHPIISLGFIAALLNLAFFLRYAGMAYIPVATVITFTGRRKSDGLLRRALSASVVSVLALLGPVLWMLRNHATDGSLLGPRYPSVVGPAAVAYQYVLAIAKLFLPGPNIFEVAIFIAVALAIGLAIRSIYIAAPNGKKRFLGRLRPWTVILLICLCYGIYLFFAELSTKIDPIDSRLLVPIYVPVVILGFGCTESLLLRSSLSNTKKQLTKRLLLVFLAIQILITCVLVGDFAVQGRDFTATAWRTSALVKATKSVSGIKLLYSNNPEGLWARLGWQNIRLLPDSVTTARTLLECPGVRIVYFTQNASGDSDAVANGPNATVSLTSLQTHLKVIPIISDSQGDILRTAGGASTRDHCS